MDERSPGELLISVVLGLAIAGGAAYGWFVVGTVWATVGGAALIGAAALVVVTALSFAVDGVAGLFKQGRSD